MEVGKDGTNGGPVLAHVHVTSPHLGHTPPEVMPVAHITNMIHELYNH